MDDGGPALPALPKIPEPAGPRLIDTYRSIERLGIVVQGGFAIIAFLLLVEIVLRGIERSLIQQTIDNPLGVDITKLLESDDRLNTFRWVLLAAFTILAVVYIVWFHRAYRNVPALGGDPRSSSKWAIAGWIVPFANFVMPKRLADDIWACSIEDGSIDSHGISPSKLLVTLWWMAWLAAGLSAQLGGFSTDSATSKDLLHDNRNGLIQFTLLLIAALLGGLVARRISNGQEHRARALSAVLPTVPEAPTTPRFTQGVVAALAAGLVILAVFVAVKVTDTSKPAQAQGPAPSGRTPQVDIPEGFQPFSSGDHAYELGLPESWATIDLTLPTVGQQIAEISDALPGLGDFATQLDKNPEALLVAMESTPGDDSLLPGQVNIIAVPRGALTTDGVAKALIDQFRGAAELRGPFERSSLKIPAGNAVRVDYSFGFSIRSSEAAATSYVIARGALAYVFNFKDGQTDAATARAQFEAVMRTVAFG